MSEFECHIKIKNCAIRQNTFLHLGGAQLGVIQKNSMSLGVRKKMPQVTKNPPPPHDFINERSLTSCFQARHFQVLNQRPREAGTSTILSVYLLFPRRTTRQLIGELLHNSYITVT